MTSARLSRHPLALTLIVLLVGCSETDSPVQTEAPAPDPVVEADVIEVQPSSWPLMARAQGSLVADEIAVVGVKVAGRIGEVHVDLGDEVTRGDKLVSLELEELKLEVTQAEAALSQARAAVGLKPGAPLESLDPLSSPPVREAQAVVEEAALKRERIERLRRDRAVTESELQEALAADKVAQAQLASAINSVNEKIALIRLRTADLEVARQRLQDAVTVAPFDGVVQQRHVAIGSYVQQGDPVVTLVRTDPLRYRGTLPERFAQRLHIGQEVHIHLEQHPEPVLTKISRLAPGVDVASRALLFEAIIENPDRRFRAGLFAEADVVIDPAHRALVVPESAITEFAGTEKVWKLAGEKAVEQAVVTGDRRADLIEVKQGLNPGDVILVDVTQGRDAVIHVRSRGKIGDDVTTSPLPVTAEAAAMIPPPRDPSDEPDLHTEAASSGP